MNCARKGASSLACEENAHVYIDMTGVKLEKEKHSAEGGIEVSDAVKTPIQFWALKRDKAQNR